MSQAVIENPILNSHFTEPTRHFKFNDESITGESTLVALEAAHIVPYSGDGDHDVSNGLLLRADFHRLFDVGLVGVTPDLKVKVSPRIRETWFNGKAYYNLDNQPLSVVPLHQSMRPDRDRLEWHLQNRFQR
jgi:putative restriction endonuclease